MDVFATYIIRDMSYKTRVQEKSSWDTTYNQKAIASTTYKQKPHHQSRCWGWWKYFLDWEEKVQEVAEEAGMLPSPLHQDSSPDSTSRWVKSLVDIYEICNPAILEKSSKKLSKSKSSSSTTRSKNKWHYQERSSTYHRPNLELLKFVSRSSVKIWYEFLE